MQLVLASEKDAQTIWALQIEAFSDLLKKYEDYEISPGSESVDTVKKKILKPDTYYYFIKEDDCTVGAIRVVDAKNSARKRISPLFIMKEFRNKGYAQLAISEVEKIHGKTNWKLDTILQEDGNCHLYEKMGYHKTGKQEVINSKMSIVYYEK